ISQFDYMRGFANVRINTYRNASIALTRYTHYSAILPDKNTFPTRSGNYLLKVFTNGDTSKTVFTKRFLVVDMKAGIAATVLQPFNTAFAKTHQKIQFSINVQSIKPTNVFQQIKVVILQNYRWDQSIKNIQPTFIRQNILEYNTENESLFPAQKEWRWLNLTSLRLQTDRIEKGDYTNKGQTLYVKPDGDRNGLRYMYYRDANGFCQYSTIEPINPYWQGDYATVWFRYLPSNKQPIKEQDVYLYGELTNYELTEAHKLNYNPETGFYENKQMLKQGLYDYIYLLKNKKTGTIASDLTEGNWFETENNYTILVYYRPLGGRADELIAISLINSIANRPSMENRLL
ncbi:MAG: type IX secretion system plug protein domain-containing protein, partial [Bacteroidota bacterium]